MASPWYSQLSQGSLSKLGLNGPAIAGLPSVGALSVLGVLDSAVGVGGPDELGGAVQLAIARHSNSPIFTVMLYITAPLQRRTYAP
ncbi:MAG: hypothetical protein AAF528_04820 [Cyanobacteria bacterium P01_C01_bin.121]